MQASQEKQKKKSPEIYFQSRNVTEIPWQISRRKRCILNF